ncbi:quinone-oxidoreductase QR1, chloroplastic-like [Apium graveolens]|uniref:quinone-oxidoreductase QR1, chloroplastic-like n=1 Tax=Apium graveolens TaxID=4045 RepID=UPI003D78C675
MKAVQYFKYGHDDLKNVEVPIPMPKKDEVLIKVEAVGINPIDFKIQHGFLRPLAPKKFPHIPGSDIAGEVVDVGPAVTKFKKGDKVVAMLGTLGGGGLAEYAVAKQELTVLRPLELSAGECAALGTPGLTAYQCLITGGVILKKDAPPMNILITAASGGVGHYAVQLAKLGNTHVTVTCGSRNIDFVKSLGADVVLDYRTPDGKALVGPSARRYDAVVHCTSGISWSTFENVLTSNGIVVDITPSPKSITSSVVKRLSCSKKTLHPLFVSHKAEDLEYLMNLMLEGKLKTVVDSKYDFANTQEAWAKSMEGHAVGKIIVEM